LEEKKKDHSYRYFKHIVRNSKTFPLAHEQIVPEPIPENREITIWCSNDYLGLGRHPYVKSEVMKAVDIYGVGSGGTRNISGNTPFHTKLETELARLHQKESALLFTSCYVANDTTLFTLAKMIPKCQIFSDAGNHASMIQGIRNSGVPKHIFRHNDVKHLEELLKKVPVETPKIVAFESVHSMDGSICDIEEMCDVTHKYGGLAFIDEVHAVGLYGKNGAGVGERDNVLSKMDVISGTLGKAFGNVGGYIAGSRALVDGIRSYGAGFIFTTSLPPSVAFGALAAIKVSCSDEGRELRARHQHNATVLKKRLIESGLPVVNSPSHIVPIFVGNAQHASDICNLLLQEYGIYIQSINYPTVARGEERLRIVPTPLHTDKMIDDLVDALVSVWTKCELKLRIEAIRNARKTPIICKSCNNEVMNDIDWRNTCKNLVLKKECEVISA
jgi:5-aminolevulinate synthase